MPPLAHSRRGALIFAAVQHLISAARGVSDKYDAIINLMESLRDFTVRLETYARQVISDSLGARLTEIVLALIEVLAISREAIKHGRFWSLGKSIIGENKAAEAAMAKLGRLVEGERGLVQAETLTEVKSITTGVAGIDTKVTALSKDIEMLTLAQNAAREEGAGDEDQRRRGQDEDHPSAYHGVRGRLLGH